MNDRGRRCFPCDGLQEGAFALIGLDQMDPRARLVSKSDRGDQSWKSGAGAEIEPSPRLGDRLRDLQRIGKMPDPYVVEGRFSDQIDCALPFFEEIRVDFETPESLLRQIREEGMSGADRGKAQDQGPARRSFDARRVMAAGVIPSIRRACPMVRGRIFSSRARISLESPGKPA